MRRLGAFLILLAACAASPAHAQGDALRLSRLSALGRLFGVVHYFHPAFLERGVPWDSATVVAIDAVHAARSTEDYRTAVGRLLESLDDRESRLAIDDAPKASADSRPPARRWETAGGESTLVLAIPGFEDFSGVRSFLGGSVEDVRSARSIVIDLRGGPAGPTGGAGYAMGRVEPWLAARTVQGPAVRMRMYSGFAPETGTTSGGYWSGTYEAQGPTFRAAARGRKHRVVFLLDEHSEIPESAHALREDGQAIFVVQAASPSLPGAATTYRVDMGEGIAARVRIGASTVSTDADVAILDPEAALRRAIELSRTPHAARSQPPAKARRAPTVVESYPGVGRYPAHAYRLLAAYRYWNAIHYFYPYKHLIGESWAATLPRMIESLSGARDSLEFAQSLARMVTWTRDSHSGITGNVVFQSWMGRSPAAVDVQYVEGQPVVVRVGEDSTTRATGIAVGDVIVSVDGELASARRARVAPLVATSTPQGLDDAIASTLLAGNADVAEVVVRGADRRERPLRLPRKESFWELMQFPRPGPAFRMLPGNIGYADLSLLTVAMVDSMFEAFRNTRGIVFDDRGYPQGTAWSIAPRLSNRSVPAASFQRPVVMSPDSSTWTTHHFIQNTPPGTNWEYRGRTVLLVDERTISQAEHTGLFLEAANRTTIVGSPTRGANGDVTNVALVGGMYARFTGHDVRHADGRVLQRIGLQPDVVVKPTIAGIRAGRDEVLDRGVALIRNSRGAIAAAKDGPAGRP